MMRCNACGEPVIMARTEALKWQPLDPVPNPAGNVHAYQANGNWHARSVPSGTPAVLPDQLFMPHAATCKPPDAEKPAEPLSGVAFLDAYRQEQSKRSARQRRGKGRRSPKVTGVTGRPR